MEFICAKNLVVHWLECGEVPAYPVKRINGLLRQRPEIPYARKAIRIRTVEGRHFNVTNSHETVDEIGPSIR